MPNILARDSRSLRLLIIGYNNNVILTESVITHISSKLSLHFIMLY